MNNEEKECLIAKACGWKVSDAGWWSHDTLPDNGGAEPDHPWYFSDLNACHEMEKSLNHDQAREYCSRVAAITGQEFAMKDGRGALPIIGAVLHATAAQRAEAFGLTLKLWT